MLLNTPDYCWNAYLQPYTIRAERWSAMRPCLYEAMTDVLGRHAQSGHAGGYLSRAAFFSTHPKTVGTLTCNHTPFARNDGLPCVRAYMRR